MDVGGYVDLMRRLAALGPAPLRASLSLSATVLAAAAPGNPAHSSTGITSRPGPDRRGH